MRQVSTLLTINQMKGEVLRAYPGEKWHKKVEKMPDMQIMAIYENLRRRKNKAKNVEKVDSEEKFMEIFEEEAQKFEELFKYGG